ncbi:amino acid adenylation domain-containing protein [Plantactinospora sp. WMMC1484]|uniref:amino acid adenylation domain-containing protein n=1 Tax=Plantactinospora sp. WMMC1484 TaxID=3404122 RepID=UPI003BF4942C
MTDPTRNEHRRAPLSYAQRRLWFIDRLLPGRAAYNIPFGYRIRGRLDRDALQRAVHHVVDRHEVLRTRIETVDGEPYQVIDADGGELRLIDLRDADDPESSARWLAAAEVDTPFSLSAGPLFRVALLRLADEDHVLLCTAHHAVFDGWSLVVLTEDLTAAYRAYSRGSTPPPAKPPVQYADFALRQHAQIGERETAEQLEYWQRHLADAPITLELPSDRRRPAVPSAAAGEFTFPVADEVAGGVRALCAEIGATPFMVTLAAYGLLLSRLAGVSDLLVGSPVYGRLDPELRGAVGFFANTLPFRIDLTGDPTFTELVGRVRDTALEAYARQAVPFDRIVEDLAPPRDLSRNPVVQILFGLLSTGTGVERGELDLPHLAVEEFRSGTVTTRFDVELHVFETPDGGMLGRVIFARDLFEQATMEHFAHQYTALVASAVAEPGTRISELVRVTDAERALLDGWSAGKTAPALAVRTVAEHVEYQVEAHPDRVAVVSGSERLTYRQLNAEANRLASYLCEFGVGPETVVGVCLPRGTRALITVLAVIKAGGAYVPLDPSEPSSRLRFLVHDSRATLVLVDPQTAGLVTGGTAEIVGAGVSPAAEPVNGVETPVLCLDEELWQRIAQRTADNLPRRAGVDNLLYVVYTSGSTGRPKGIMMTHRSKLNMMNWFVRHYRERPQVLQFYSMSPDTYLLEVMLAWWTGGTLVVVPEEVRRDIPALGRLIEAHRITTTVLPTVVAEHLARHAEQHPEQFASLRDVATTGDRQRIGPSVRRMFAALPEAFLDNHYGQTEANVVTVNRLTHPTDDWPDQAPMGRPIDNLRVYVLDTTMRPVPVGAYGEVYVGGAGLARGYLGRPDLTAAAFVPDPSGNGRGERLYRTGDRARWRSDGTLEFAGRIDFQVKIHGYRIEPGEIESCLAALPTVEEAAVVCDTSVPEAPRLIGYVTPRAGHELTPEEVRGALRVDLPDYMLPGLLLVLDTFPRTASGKIDRRRLPLPDPVPVDGYVAPATDTEKAVAAIWGEILDIARIGRRDNFFGLGGHSLLVTRVVYRLREILGVDLPLRSMFEAVTVAELAHEIDKVLAGAVQDPHPAPNTAVAVS